MLRPKPLMLAAMLVMVAGLCSITADAQTERNSFSRPILWTDVDVASQDTFLGPGGAAMRPDLSSITFIREEKGGYSKKYRIKDGAGRTWVAKLGKEAQSETAAVRLLSALGYVTEINYLVPSITIPGKGTFRNVRLEARPDNVKRGNEWRWDRSPFTGTQPLQGLKVLMAFLNNWDTKNANNVILTQNGQQYYAISDLGVSFGKTGVNAFPLLRWIGRSRNAPADYAKAKFVSSVKNGRVKLHFNGKNAGEFRTFSLADVRWISSQLSQLSDKQIRDMFRAANYSPGEISMLTQSVKRRIEELERAGSTARLGGR